MDTSSNTFTLDLKNISHEIENAVLDPKVNIKIAPLAGDESNRMYATVLKPGSKVTAHKHASGIELYHILIGSGELYTGSVESNTDVVRWNKPIRVKQGDVFSIPEQTVHQLKNVSPSEDLLLLFSCAGSHLKDDRTIYGDYVK